ncbi:MAG: M14 family zinc carboxypeptidase [Saprospiraceae bacterium]|nr:M14 family zinc carboxypeptidase [Saprospiraceae bacterium]MDW8228561.1 M14 family zinc carboxypeptidase [Saprospiraceae bacterium]
MRITTRFAIACLVAFVLQAGFAQKPTLEYYLPAISYDSAVPRPADILGYEVGEWHVSHDQLAGYMRELARASSRVVLREYGHTHERRPLLYLTITSPENHRQLDDLRQRRRQLADPTQSSALDPAALPAVVMMGYSIHGNEASGSNAALLVAYYLAAAQSPEVEKLLQNTIILLDPCFNPDGLQRFSTWVNSRRSQTLMPDPAHEEFHEPWPGGRTNHYWFDLNRDWLAMQQPESPGRVELFQDWLPNILTDHHEMGTNTTLFFQPGVPSRVHPLTPALNQQLTARIGEYHARALSDKKVLFFSEENYDDFYYGKGSTYPDVNGCIGILFEQASSRGSAQESSHGLLTFPYTIRNQVITSLSTLQAVSDMRVELNRYLRDFYSAALTEARADKTKAYVFGAPAGSLTRPVREFIRLLLRHRIRVHPVAGAAPEKDEETPSGKTWVVLVEQPQYRLIQAIFERRTTFSDSIFYDISAWTLPDAFGLNWSPLQSGALTLTRLGPPLEREPDWPAPAVPEVTPELYAYAVGAVGYDVPRLLAALHRAGIRVLVAQRPFEAEGQAFREGTLLIPLDRQPMDAAAIRQRILQSGAEDIQVFALRNGLTPKGPDLGSANFAVLRPPKVVLVTGRDAGAAEAGEVWHLLDTRYGMSPLLVDADRFNNLDLTKYNTVVLAGGNFSRLSADKVKQFVSAGGTLIVQGTAVRWAKNAGVVSWDLRPAPRVDENVRRPYARMEEDANALSLPGAILRAELDLTHPLAYGYTRPFLPLFVSGDVFAQPPANAYATPAVYAAQPLLSGYLHPQHHALVSGAAAVLVQSSGNGRVIGFCTNPNFRGFWYGTNRLFANAVFWGNIIRTSARSSGGE